MECFDLKLNVSNIEQIIHIGDIHVRMQKRHTEYTDVFERLYIHCRTIVANNPNTIIFVAGDIAHSKTDISPEEVHVIQKFLSSLSDITDTICILGNHDMNLNNHSRLDCITPIVTAINKPSLILLSENGLYKFKNFVFNHMHVQTNPRDYVDIKQLNDNSYKIGLHHGAVHGSLTDKNYSIDNIKVTTELFNGHDIVLLGDIHKQQTLSIYDQETNTPTTAYCGSLIQQNFGETIDMHGLLLWDIHTRSYIHYEVYNDYGYVTIDVTPNYILSDQIVLPKFTRLKFKYNPNDINISKLKELEHELSTKTTIVYTTYSKTTNQNIVNIGNNKLANLDYTDVEVQNKLLSEYIDTKYGIQNKDFYTTLHHLNRKVNTLLDKTTLQTNSIIQIHELQFDNMFSYGTGNKINFENLSGIYGIFATNRSGKSSVIDALLYTIFDKCSKTDKASHVLNTDATSFIGTVKFSIDGKKYIIERTGVKHPRTGKVKVNVDFSECDDSWNIINSLNGDERDQTNQNIRKYIGSYSDFLMTSIYSQVDNTGFIELGKTDRKDLVYRFLNLGIFDKLHHLANDEYRTLTTKLKMLLAVTNNIDMSELDVELIHINSNIQNYKSEIIEYNKLLDKAKEEESKIKFELSNIPTNVLDIKKLNIQKNILTTSIDNVISQMVNTSEQIKNITNSIEQNNIKYTELCQKIQSYDHSQINLITNSIESVQSLIKINTQKITEYDAILENLNSLSFSDDCSYCKNNKQVLEVDVYIDKKSELIGLLESLKMELKHHTNDLQQVQKIHSIYEQTISLTTVTDTLNKTKFKAEQELHKYEIQLKDLEHKLSECNTNIDLAEQQMELFNKQEHMITQLEKVNTFISKIQKQISDVETKLHDSILKQGSKQHIKDQLLNNINDIKECEYELEVYTKYIYALSKEGLPYELVRDVLPILETEVNNVLSNIVNFVINFEQDGKNINANICYDDKTWPIELVSGMERFISSLAIRLALQKITTIQKVNFLIIDEGFTQLDSEHMNSLYSLMEYLSLNNQFVLLISHLELMRDLVDSQITIDKLNGKSFINIE